MTTARVAVLPIDHVLAEMAALPLVSEISLQRAICQLDPKLSDDTAKLWREAEHLILGSFPAFSVDEAVAIRDYFWFYQCNQDKPIRLQAYFKWLAKQFLEYQGHNATPALPNKSNISGFSEREPVAVWARVSWRWLSFALPPDLLLAALHKNEKCPKEIDFLNPAVYRCLNDHGYAETHLHIGAALEFPLLWSSLVRAIADPKLKQTAFQSPGASLDEGKAFGPWLIRTAIARYILAAYLSCGQKDFQNLRNFVHHWVIPKVLLKLDAGSVSLLIFSLSDLSKGSIDTSLNHTHLQGMYARLIGSALMSYKIPNDVGQVIENDPIAAFFPEQPNPEKQFVVLGLTYLEQTPQDDNFAVLFWQVIRIRAMFYRHVVQRPMTPGLQWFLRFYGRIKPARPKTTSVLIQSAAMIDGIGKGLKSLEFRTSPTADRSEMLQFVANIDLAIRSSLPKIPIVAASETGLKGFEIGLVLHFTKDRGGDAMQGKPKPNWMKSHADPRDNPSGYRYARYYNQKKNEAQALAWLLQNYPNSLKLIRALDVCTDELGIPNWVLAPLFRYVREISNDASTILYQHHQIQTPPLRLTAHSGEDFLHLLTGLRHVDETINRFAMREGDRIGHGMALGVDPVSWCEQAGRIPMPIEVRLFDLAWEWSWYARENTNPPPGRILVLEREIARLSQIVFNKPLSPFELELFVDQLYSEEALFLLGFPNINASHSQLQPNQELKLLQLYLTDVPLFKRSRITEWVDPNSEKTALALLQSELRKKIGQRSIAVEVNPSSNLLIGDMCDLTTHPLWRLNPPPGSNVTAPPVSICVGSDDPLTFATNLRQEYQLLHDALVLAGCSEAEASHWLDNVRSTGLNYRFTLNEKIGNFLDKSMYHKLSVNLPP